MWKTLRYVTFLGTSVIGLWVAVQVLAKQPVGLSATLFFASLATYLYADSRQVRLDAQRRANSKALLSQMRIEDPLYQHWVRRSLFASQYDYENYIKTQRSARQKRKEAEES